MVLRPSHSTPTASETISTAVIVPKATTTTPSGWVRRQSSVGNRPSATTMDTTGQTRCSARTPSSTATGTSAATSAQSRHPGAGGSGARGSVHHERTASRSTVPSVENRGGTRIGRKDGTRTLPSADRDRPESRCGHRTRRGRCGHGDLHHHNAPDDVRHRHGPWAAPAGHPPGPGRRLVLRPPGQGGRRLARRARSPSSALAGALGPHFSSSSGVPDSGSAAGFAVLAEHFPELGTGGQSGTIVFTARPGSRRPRGARRDGGVVRPGRRRVPRRRRCAPAPGGHGHLALRRWGSGPDRTQRSPGRPGGLRPGEPVRVRGRHRVRPPGSGHQ